MCKTGRGKEDEDGAGKLWKGNLGLGKANVGVSARKREEVVEMSTPLVNEVIVNRST